MAMVSSICGPDMTLHSSVIALVITAFTAFVRLLMRGNARSRKLHAPCPEAAQLYEVPTSSLKEFKQAVQFRCCTAAEDWAGMPEQERESDDASDASAPLSTKNGVHLLMDATLVINSIEDVRQVCDYGIQDVFRELVDEDGPFPVFAYVTEKESTCTSEVEFYDNEGFVMGVVEGGMMSPPEIHQWEYAKLGAEEVDLDSAALVAARHLGCNRLPCGRPEFWIPA